MELPSGSWSMIKLRCSPKQLSKEDRREILRQWPDLRKTHCGEAVALVDGLADNFRSMYLNRMQQKTGRPSPSFKDTPAIKAKFKEAAIRCFESGISPERYIACAEATFRFVRFPTPNQIGGEHMSQIFKDWLPPTERMSRDGEPVTFFDSYFGPKYTPCYTVPLNGNWPGLYGK